MPGVFFLQEQPWPRSWQCPEGKRLGHLQARWPRGQGRSCQCVRRHIRQAEDLLGAGAGSAAQQATDEGKRRRQEHRAVPGVPVSMLELGGFQQLGLFNRAQPLREDRQPVAQLGLVLGVGRDQLALDLLVGIPERGRTTVTLVMLA
jgi:hypothetical protein